MRSPQDATSPPPSPANRSRPSSPIRFRRGSPPSSWQLLKSPLLYLSLYFKQNQAAYYRWLGAVRTEGDWLRFFLIGVEDSAENATHTVRSLCGQINADRQNLLALQGATVSAIQLFERLPEHPRNYDAAGHPIARNQQAHRLHRAA